MFRKLGIIGMVVAAVMSLIDPLVDPIYGMAAPSTQPKNFQGGVIRLSDGTGSPVTLTAGMTQGDIDFGELGEYLNEDIIYTTRTLIIGLGSGKPRPLKISGSFLVGNIVGSTNSAPGSFIEFATKKGAYSGNVSTLGASRRMTIDIRQTFEGTAWGDTADETVDFEDCVVTFKVQEREEGNLCTWTATQLGNTVVTNNTNAITYAQAA